MADRYAYIPFIGLFLMSTWLVADWAGSRKISAAWLAIPAVSCLLVLGDADLPSSWLLARYRVILAPHDCADGEQLVCPRLTGRLSEQPGQG